RTAQSLDPHGCTSWRQNRRLRRQPRPRARGTPPRESEGLPAPLTALQPPGRTARLQESTLLRERCEIASPQRVTLTSDSSCPCPRERPWLRRAGPSKTDIGSGRLTH